MTPGDALAAFAVALAGLVVFVGAPAAAVTKLVDFVRAFDTGDTWPKWLWIALSFVFGIVIALLFQIDGIGAVIASVPRFAGTDLSDNAGQILTGFAIGGVASGLHEKFDQWSATAKAAKAGLTTVPPARVK